MFRSDSQADSAGFDSRHPLHGHSFQAVPFPASAGAGSTGLGAWRCSRAPSPPRLGFSWPQGSRARLCVHRVSGEAPVMVGPGDELAPRAGGHGHLRASDSDRAHVIDNLKAAYVNGLVTKDEFDARVSQALASRTHAELALVTADLPAAQQRPWPAPARGNAPADTNVRPGDRAISATAVFAGLALVISISAGPFASPAAFLLLL